ncbi:MAG: flagellar protein FlaG [Firmicutes bacterium]|nr:flagellar protein FlaG [Bacillota bacterium]MDD3851473.1 flagellar protein FlaG [Bacillota bacterium]
MRVAGVGNACPVTKIDGNPAEQQVNGIKSQKPGDIAKSSTPKEDRWANPGAAVEVSLGEQEIIDAIERANKALQGVDRRFEFSIHDKTREIMVKVINDETDEIIREIPPEKILDMVAKIWELAGLMVDRKI